MEAHVYPRPMWHPDKPGVVAYAANKQEMEKMKTYDGQGNPNGGGWQSNPIPTRFPLALHAAGGQGIKVNSEEELDRALKNGWSLKPVVDEDPVMMPASPDRPPLPVDESDQVPEAPKGRRKKEVAA